MKNLFFIVLLLTTRMAQGETTFKMDLELARNGDVSAQNSLSGKYYIG